MSSKNICMRYHNIFLKFDIYGKGGGGGIEVPHSYNFQFNMVVSTLRVHANFI